MMAGLVATAGATQQLANPSLALTVFAPTDAAFQAAAKSTGANTAALMRNRAIVQLVFRYHIVKVCFAAVVGLLWVVVFVVGFF